MGRRWVWGVVGALVGGFLFAAAEARASSFQVTPITLALSAGADSSILSIDNQGQEPVRLQLTANSWIQSPDGSMQLTPTEDLVVFPRLLTVPPGTKKNVRVAAAVGFEATEKAYRLFVEELPGMQQAAGENTVRVLMKMGVPVFLAPTGKGKGIPRLDAASLQGGKVRVGLVNTGTAHFTTRQLLIAGFAADGTQLYEIKEHGWYLLPGGRRDFVVNGPSNLCAATRVAIEADTDAGKATIELSGDSAQCH